jgi:hypothetical protein
MKYSVKKLFFSLKRVLVWMKWKLKFGDHIEQLRVQNLYQCLLMICAKHAGYCILSYKILFKNIVCYT